MIRAKIHIKKVTSTTNVSMHQLRHKGYPNK